MNLKDIKSWQIALIGSIISLIVPIKLLAMPFKQGTEGDILAFFLALLTFVISAILLIPAILLKFDKTKEAGAILSIIFGLGVSYVAYLVYLNEVSELAVPLLVASSYILAGTHYFWKKRYSK